MRERLARRVVDDLRVDVLRAAEHAEARALGRAGDLLADAELAALPADDLHAHGRSSLSREEAALGAARCEPCKLLLAALARLARLLAHALAAVAHALAAVGLRRAEAADLRGGLPDELLVGAVQDEHGALRVGRGSSP